VGVVRQHDVRWGAESMRIPVESRYGGRGWRRRVWAWLGSVTCVGGGVCVTEDAVSLCSWFIHQPATLVNKSSSPHCVALSLSTNQQFINC